MAKPKKVVLREADLADPKEAHALVAEQLDFPDYYGANLDALADCLEDVVTPTRIILKRARERKAWFDGFVRVVSEVARESDGIRCTIRNS